MSSQGANESQKTTARGFIAKGAKAAGEYRQMLAQAPIHRGHKQEMKAIKTLVVFSLLFLFSDLFNNFPLYWPNLIEITGCLASILFLFSCRDLKSKMKQSVIRLTDRQTLVFRKIDDTKQNGEEVVNLGDEAFDGLRNAVIEESDRVAEKWARWCATFFFALALAYMYFSTNCVTIDWKFEACISFFYIYSSANLGFLTLIPFLFFKVSIIGLCSWFVGAFLGRMACYGYCMRSYHQLRFDGHGISLLPSPGHVDGKCGLRPINDFLFYQAQRVFIIVIYLFAWHFIFVNLSDRSANQFYEIDSLFLIALALIIVLQFIGLGFPIASVRRRVLDEKVRLERESDKDWRKAEIMRATLKDALKSDQRQETEKRIAAHEKSYRDVEAMRLWPFTLDSGSAFLLLGVQAIPLILSVGDKSGKWLKLIGSFFS